MRNTWSRANNKGDAMKEITIVADDKVGMLADISYILGKAKINIESVTASAMEGKAIVTLMLKDEKRAAELLKNNGYKVLESEIFVVKLKDEPGQLSGLSKELSDAGVSISSLYVVARDKGATVVALRVDKPHKAKKVLAQHILAD